MPDWLFWSLVGLLVLLVCGSALLIPLLIIVIIARNKRD
jgi:hypothetical protein